MNGSPKEKKPMGTEPEIVARLRPVESDLALPQGWTSQEIRWDGVDREIAFDSRRFKVMRISAGAFDEELREMFDAFGWTRLGMDREGAELWARDRQRSGLARLDQLRGARAEGPTALFVA
jgi:hypothetical protein